MINRRGLLAIGAAIALLWILAGDHARATFGGSTGSIQFRNPPWLRALQPAVLSCPGGTCSIDWRQGPWFQTKLTQNVTFNAPSNVGSQCILITLIQDSVGSRTATWTNTTGGAGWKWSGGTAGTLTTTAGAVDQVVACPWQVGFPSSASLVLQTNFK